MSTRLPINWEGACRPCCPCIDRPVDEADYTGEAPF